MMTVPTHMFLVTLAECLRADGFAADVYRLVAEQVRAIMRAAPNVFDHEMLAPLVAVLRDEGVTSSTLTSTDVIGYTPAGTSDDEERALTEQIRALMREAEAQRP